MQRVERRRFIVGVSLFFNSFATDTPPTALQTLLINRPRLLLHGPLGMGQPYVAAALLHHLEGYHVQSLELGVLLGDSARVGTILVVLSSY